MYYKSFKVKQYILCSSLESNPDMLGVISLNSNSTLIKQHYNWFKRMFWALNDVLINARYLFYLMLVCLNVLSYAILKLQLIQLFDQ